jgi:hypothetical protein
MPSNETFSVVGLRKNGDRVVITRDTSHEIAEKIVSMMTVGGGFVELFIVAAGDAREPVSAGLAETR